MCDTYEPLAQIDQWSTVTEVDTLHWSTKNDTKSQLRVGRSKKFF